MVGLPPTGNVASIVGESRRARLQTGNPRIESPVGRNSLPGFSLLTRNSAESATSNTGIGVLFSPDQTLSPSSFLSRSASAMRMASTRGSVGETSGARTEDRVWANPSNRTTSQERFIMSLKGCQEQKQRGNLDEAPSGRHVTSTAHPKYFSGGIMNRKFLLAWLAVFVTWMAGSFIVHGTLLHDDYAALPNLF